MENNLKLIGTIDFKDVKVNVFYDESSTKEEFGCTWRMRNPDSVYKGIMFMNLETGKITYPEDAIIPVQTEKDREILPQAIITGYNEIDSHLSSLLLTYLDNTYIRNNPNLS